MYIKYSKSLLGHLFVVARLIELYKYILYKILGVENCCENLMCSTKLHIQIRAVVSWGAEPFFSRLQKVFSALGRKYYIMLTINFCILAIYFGTHEYLEQNPILLLNSLMMCLKICEKFFWIIM